MICSITTLLRAHRLLLNEPARVFGQNLGVSQATVSAWEIGTRPLPAKALAAWAQKYLFSQGERKEWDIENTGGLLDVLSSEQILDGYIADTASSGLLSYCFADAVVRELLFLQNHYSYLFDWPSASFLPNIATDNLNDYFAGLLMFPKAALFEMAEQNEELKTLLQWLVTLVLERVKIAVHHVADDSRSRYSTEYTCPEIISGKHQAFKFDEHPNLFYSIPATLARSDCFRLCFSGVGYREVRGIRPPLSFEGISGHEYSACEWLSR